MTPDSPDELLAGFEASTLPSFSHREHIHVAWMLLQRHPVLEAIARMDRGIRALAVARDLPGLYHATVTWALLFLIHERIREAPEGESFAEFERRCPLLFTGWREHLDRLYGMDVLQSGRAREAFVMPDPMPGSLPIE